jgi:hypothetical protein
MLPRFHRALRVAGKQSEPVSPILIIIVTCNQYLFEEFVKLPAPAFPAYRQAGEGRQGGELHKKT